MKRRGTVVYSFSDGLGMLRALAISLGWILGMSGLPLVAVAFDSPAGCLSDSLPAEETPAAPVLFDRLYAARACWCEPRLITPQRLDGVHSEIESQVALVGCEEDVPAASRAAARLLPLSPPDGLRRSGAERRPTALSAEIDTLDWFLVPDQELSDHARQSTRSALLTLTTGAYVANSAAFLGDRTESVDHQIHLWYQSKIRNDFTDEQAKSAKLLGEGKYILPAVGALYLTTRLFDDGPLFGPLNGYSDRLAKSYVAGLPLLLLSQYTVGASRPFETAAESRWQFLGDMNGVSGHAFVGAMPFLVGATMVENPLLKGGLFAASAATGLSRMNDGAHYPSQIFLGWCLAFAVSTTVAEQPFYDDRFSFVPVATPDMTGIALLVSL